MEIINHNPSFSRSCDSQRGRNIYLGVVLAAAGLVWLLYNVDALSYRFFDTVFSWQMLMVVLGGYLLTVRSWIAGGIVTSLGVASCLTDFLGIDIPVSKIVLPVLLIVLGVGLLLRKAR